MIDLKNIKHVFLYPGCTDMRLGLYGLRKLNLKTSELEEKSLYIFYGHKLNQIKIISFNDSNFSIFTILPFLILRLIYYCLLPQLPSVRLFSHIQTAKATAITKCFIKKYSKYLGFIKSLSLILIMCESIIPFSILS